MRPSWLALLLVILVVGLVQQPSVHGVLKVKTNLDYAKWEKWVNVLRSTFGRKKIKLTWNLSQAAQTSANQMEATDKQSHDNPVSLLTRAKALGSPVTFIAENIFHWGTSAWDTFRQLVKSPSHLKNFLSSKVNAFGVGRNGNSWSVVLAKLKDKPKGTLVS